MTAELARVGGPLASAGLAVLYVAPRRVWRLAGLAAWALGALLLAVHLAPHGHRVVLAGAAVAGLVLAAALAALFVRWPWLFAVAALACVPARIPVHVGSTDANLLVPLYGVVAAGALTFLWEERRQGEPVSAEELCRDCPELLAEVRRRRHRRGPLPRRRAAP